MSKDKINESSIFLTEYIDTPETEIIEENFFIDEKILKNKELVRMDMNLVQYPIFSKNTKRKINQITKYYFNSNRNTYITVTPQAGDYIPGEAEEKVFIALMLIMKEKGMTKDFLVTATELKNKLKIKTQTYLKTIKKALLRLSATNYNFKNTLYSSVVKGVIEREISTPILTLEIITLSFKENKKYRDVYRDKRIKEIYRIKISDHFYENIIQKGYMVYNSSVLLDINTSTARTVYMLIEKLRYSKLDLLIDTIFLIKRIPLKYDKKNLATTIKILERAFRELEEKRLIKSFKFIKDSTWEKSEIEINFDEVSNINRQQDFFNERNDFRKILVLNNLSDTEHEMIEGKNILNETIVTKDMVIEVLESMPKKAKELKTMPNVIKESIKQYGLEKVKEVALYMRNQNVEKIRSYFIKALENNWKNDDKVLEYEEFQEKSARKENSIELQYDENIYSEFENLSKEIQTNIEDIVYKEYIQKCGMETKIQKIAFLGSRKKHICDYLINHSKILNNIEKNIDESHLIDIEEATEKVVNILNTFKSIDSYNKKRLDEEKLLSNILKDLIPLVMNSKLTKNKLNEIIIKYLGNISFDVNMK